MENENLVTKQAALQSSIQTLRKEMNEKGTGSSSNN